MAPRPGNSDNAPIKQNRADNQGSKATDILTDAGDIIYNNVRNQTKRLPIGLNNEILSVRAGAPDWVTGQGEEMRISYWSFPQGNAWNATLGVTGLPFDETSLSKWDHSHAIHNQFLSVNGSGAVVENTNAQGGFTSGNIVTYKNNTQELWVTVKCTALANMEAITDDLTGVGVTARSVITTFVTTHSLSGVDIWFNDQSSWDSTAITNLNTWLGSLKSDLSVPLNLTLDAIVNATVAGNYGFDYSTFLANVDFITIEAFNCPQEFSYTCPTMPKEALVGGRYNDRLMWDDAADAQGTTVFYANGVLGKFASDVGNNMHKLIIGLPATGNVHTHTDSIYTFRDANLTVGALIHEPDYNLQMSDLKRDHAGELRLIDSAETFVMNDAVSMRSKMEICKKWLEKWELDNPTLTAARREVIFYHMGGSNHTIYD